MALPSGDEYQHSDSVLADVVEYIGWKADPQSLLARYKGDRWLESLYSYAKASCQVKIES